MSELQNDDVQPEVEAAPIADQDTGADLATASEGSHEDTTQVDEAAKKQAAIDKIIGEQTFKAKQAQRNEQAANDKLKVFEKEKAEREAAAVAIIPDVPDPYGDDFDGKMATRDAALLAQANHNSNQAAIQQQAQHQQQQAIQQQQERVQKSAIAYDARATELGISKDELQAAGGAVLNYGLSEELAMHILSDPEGPLIIKHLAANPQEGFDLASMSPYEAEHHLSTVRAKVEALKPKTSSTPDPVDNLQGNGIDPNAGKYPNIKGTVYS